MSMLKKPLARILIVSSFLFLLGVVALAAAGRKNGVVLSADHRTTIATHPSGHVVAPPSNDASLTEIAGNLSKYPYGVYFCCYGETISGPDSQIGEAFWAGIPFTPSTNVTATKISTSVGYVNGNNSVALSLNADNNGVPGAVLATADASNLGTFGDCCTLASVGGSSKGINLTAGTQYWVVAYTDNNSQNTWDAWAYNTTDMRDFPWAFYDNGTWEATEGILPGYAVYGH